ncbi:MAG: hypothetical protein LBG79_06475, partial [Spirochaetaceae bacterium]|nr:hypothetical protein [Spirochaetaceae bacterium]
DILKRILRAAESVAKTNPPDFRQGSFDIETETVNTETFEDEAAGAEEMVEEIEDVEYLDEFEDEDEVAALYNAVPAAEESVEDDYSNFFPPVLPQNINAAGKGSDQKLEALSSAIHAEIRRNDLKNGTKNYSRDGSIWKYAITGKTKQKAAKTNEWSYLEADPFSGFDSEESKTSLNSDDFSYGIFVANKNAVPAQKPQSGMEQECDPEAEKVTAQMPKDKASYKPPSNKKILKSPPEARAYKDSGREAAAPAPSKTAPATPLSFTQATEPPKATPAHTAPATPAPATPATATSAATFTKKSEAQEGVPVKMPPAHTTAAAAPPAAQAQEKPAIENEANIPVFLDSGLAPAPPDNIETFAEFAETDAVASTEDFAEELEELPSVNDSNQIAMRIEFAPENNSNNSNGWDHDFDKDMVITSPVDELFADVENDDVIKERGGVPYISTGGVLDKKEKEKLDPNIKTLVDSVLSP